jgi:hypothetical protein
MVIRVLQGSRLDFGPRAEQIPEVRTRIPALQNIPTTSKSATAVAQFGQDISASGIQLARVGAINQARDEDREAQAGEVAVTQKIRGLQRELLAKPGQSALDFEPEYNRRLDEIINTQAGSASNEAVARILSKRLSDVRERALNKAGGHFVQARTDAEAGTDLLERQILMESLGDDPLNEELLKKFAFLNAKELNRKGIKNQEHRTHAQKTALSALYKDIITNYIDEGRVAEADALFKTAFVVGNLTDKDKANLSAKLRLRTVDLRARQNLLNLNLALPDGSETEYNKEADKLSPDDAKALKELIKDDFVVRRRAKTEAVDAIKEKLQTQIENGDPLILTSDEEVLADKHGLINIYKGIQRNIKSGVLLSPDLPILAEIQAAKENGTFKDIDLFQKDGKYSQGLGKEFIRTLKEQLAAKAMVMTDSKEKEKELKKRRKEVLDLSRMGTFNAEMKDALDALKFSSSQLADVKLVASRRMHEELQRDPTRIGFTNQEMNSILQQAAAEVRVKDTGLFGFFQTEQLLATSILNGDPVTAESLEPVTQRILKELPSPFKVGANATSDQKTAAAAATQKYNNDIHRVVNHLVQNKILPTPITVENFLRYQRKKVATLRAARFKTFPEAATDVFDDPGRQIQPVPTADRVETDSGEVLENVPKVPATPITDRSFLPPALRAEIEAEEEFLKVEGEPLIDFSMNLVADVKIPGDVKLGTEVVGKTIEGRDVYQNPDGTVSSERTATVKLPNDTYMNVPTIFKGKEVSEDKALKIIQDNNGIDPETDRKLPTFTTKRKAVAAAEKRSEDAEIFPLAKKKSKEGVIMKEQEKKRVVITRKVINALAKIESGGDIKAESPVGALGKFQIMPKTAANPGFGVKPLSTGTDVLAAPVAEQERFMIDYLGALTRELGSLRLGLMAYNWGYGNVRKWLTGKTTIIPKETRNYIKKFQVAGILEIPIEDTELLG